MPDQNDNMQAKGARLYGLNTTTDTWEPILTDGSGSIVVNPGGAAQSGFGSASTQGSVQVSSASAVLIAVGASNFSGRNKVIVTPINTPIYWALNNSTVTTANGHFLGTKETGEWAMEQPSSTIYMVASQTGSVVVTEST